MVSRKKLAMIPLDKALSIVTIFLSAAVWPQILWKVSSENFEQKWPYLGNGER